MDDHKLEYRVEEDLYARSFKGPKFRVSWHNKHFDLWLSVDNQRYDTIEEANVKLAKLRGPEPTKKRAVPKS